MTKTRTAANTRTSNPTRRDDVHGQPQHPLHCIHPRHGRVDDGAGIHAEVKVWHFSHVMSEAVIGHGTSLGQNTLRRPRRRHWEKASKSKTTSASTRAWSLKTTSSWGRPACSPTFGTQEARSTDAATTKPRGSNAAQRWERMRPFGVASPRETRIHRSWCCGDERRARPRPGGRGSGTTHRVDVRARQAVCTSTKTAAPHAPFRDRFTSRTTNTFTHNEHTSRPTRCQRSHHVGGRIGVRGPSHCPGLCQAPQCGRI